MISLSGVVSLAPRRRWPPTPSHISILAWRGFRTNDAQPISAFHDFEFRRPGRVPAESDPDGRDAIKELDIRTTRVFRLINGRWRQVHHHGSTQDAKLLAEYQNAVRSAQGTAAP